MKFYFLAFAIGSFLNLYAQDSATSKKKVHKIITQHPAQYQYTRLQSDYISDAALGIDYQQESFSKKFDWDNSNNYQNSGGFNIYFLSGSKLSQFLPVGSSHWGTGFSMNFYGDSKYHNVQINSANKDSAKTRISVISPEFYLTGRYEYKFGRFYPFFGIKAGVKWYSTSQNTETLMPLKDYENSTSTNLNSTGSLYVASEVGVRVKLTHVTSFVASYGWIQGGNVNLVDVENSTFNSWQFELNKKQASMNVSQIKFGFLFDLSSGRYDKKLIKEAYSDTTIYDENTNQPCPCCDKCKQTTSDRYDPSYPVYHDRVTPVPSYRDNSSIFNGNGTSTPVKRPMPSITPGPSIPVKPKS